MANNWGTCRFERCSRKVEWHFCSIHEEELFAAIYGVIEKIHGISGKTYLGRSHFPELRLLEHGEKAVDRLTVLHWASCHAEAIDIERMVIEDFKHKAKLINVDANSKGGLKGPWNCIYIAWSKKPTVSDEPFQLTTVKLAKTPQGWMVDPGKRLFPKKAGSFKAVHLSRAGLSMAQVNEAVEEPYMPID